MNEPESPQYEPHSFVRSRTPADRNAERQAIFNAKQQAKADAQAVKNAEPRAGTGLRKDGNMLTATGGGRGSSSGELPLIYIDLDTGLGYEINFLTSGTRRPVTD